MYRVLVADDEPIERMIVGRTIKKYFSGQLEVVEAVNGREAVKFFTEKDCKIALLDIDLMNSVMQNVRSPYMHWIIC